MRRRFSVALPFLALYLLVLSCMLALGYWQLQRAGEKESLLASAAAARTAAPLAAGEIDHPVDAASEHRRVRVTGLFLADRQFLWDNRTHQGVAGYEVITPVRLADDRLVLVNRGWVPPGPTRDDLPDIALPKAAVADHTGLFTRPSKGLMSGPAVNATSSWPRVLQYFDYAALEAALGEPIVPGVVQLQEIGQTSSALYLYIANWQPAGFGPERHYGYAFQWFAMAAALTVLFIVVNIRSSQRRRDDSVAPWHETDSR